MRDQWRAEEDARHRPESRHRTTHKFDRRPRSPPPARREASEDRYRDRELVASESYRPARERESSREPRKHKHRRLSPSPRRHTKSQQDETKRLRPLGERITHPRGKPSAYSPKRRRTRSPSPTRSDRYLRSARRDSRSRDRLDRRDRAAGGTDRAFSPRRASPTRPPRPERRAETPVLDTYFPSRRNRDRSRTPPFRHRRERSRYSRSPRRESPPRPSRRDRGRDTVRKPRNSSRSPIRPRLSQSLSPTRESKARRKMHLTQKIQSIMDDPNRPPSPSRPNSHYQQSNHDPMDGRPPMRGGYLSHNNTTHHHRPPRPPPVDTRQSFAGSPGFVTPNSSYHGSPQSGSPFGNRGGWGGQQQYHGLHG